jgi:hypothetical protein
LYLNVQRPATFSIHRISEKTGTFPGFHSSPQRLALPMLTSPSDSSASFVSHSSSREPTPEWDPIAEYEKQAPLHWDADGWDFAVASESDGNLTDGDDLQFLVDGELDSDTSTEWSWAYDGESSDVEESLDNDDDPMSGNWMCMVSSDDEDDENDDDGNSDYGSSDEDSNDSGDNDGDDDGGASQCDEMPPSKRRPLQHDSLFW